MKTQKIGNMKSKRIFPEGFIKLFGITTILLIFGLLFLPTANYYLYGKFTWSFEKAQEYAKDKSFEELGDSCEFGAVSYGGGLAECQQAPCKTYNIDEKDCVREGLTGGFFDSHIYYVCKDYGRMARSCIDYFDSQDEVNKYYGLGEYREDDI